MVMLTRGWSRFLVLVGFVLELLAGLTPMALSDDDEPTEPEAALTLHAQGAEQSPPPHQSMPLSHRRVHAWPQPEEFWHPSWSGRAARLNVITFFRSGSPEKAGA
jgi:hypothetical protein